jgi:uracil-DNA glycosylase
VSIDFDDFWTSLTEEPERATGALDDLFEGRQDYNVVPWLDNLLACRACNARDEARRVVPGCGPLDAEIAIIGQNPGEDEDAMGVAFVGRSGSELDVWLEKLDLDRDKVMVTNAVKCHTLRNRTPTAREITTCKDRWLRQEIATFSKLAVLIPLGRSALQALLGSEKIPGTAPAVMQPWWADIALDSDDTRRLVMMPLPHPAYLLRSPNLRDKMYADVLPTVKTYLETQTPEVYARARR